MIGTLRQQERIVKQARKDMRIYYHRHLEFGPGPRGPIEYYCMFWAYFTVRAMREHGLPTAQIQAGSAFWPTHVGLSVDPDKNYGYEWIWDHHTMMRIAEGEFPEMHVWAAVANPPLIVDLTSGFFKPRALKEGHAWPGIDPPDYLWSGLPLPDGVSYEPDPQAIEVAHAYLATCMEGDPLIMALRR